MWIRFSSLYVCARVALYWGVFTALRDALTLPAEWQRALLPKSFHRAAQVVAPTGIAIGLLFIVHLVLVLVLGQWLAGGAAPRKRKQQ